ncbi:MAG: hypothetical protein A2W03_14095 [Candidatus Aminicenantes bacterium RBG_16_63_16]|nr:MAG: hypothetical protein A2W03_14095 [Candidatus Aminicenantes bacterium RBG_16_63_16]
MSKRLILLYAAALCLLLNILVPPFQNPDEIQHFATILRYTLGSGQAPAIEAEVIRLMDRFDWWRMAGMGRPAKLPDRFSDIPFLKYSESAGLTGHLVLYHAALGALLKLLPSKDVLSLYHASRVFSALLFGGSLLLLAAAFANVAASQGATRGLGFFFVLFLPQFSVLSLSVNPESLSIFWGALFFYGLVSWCSGAAGSAAIIILPLTALAGFLTDRSSFYLIPLAAVLPLFFWRRGRPLRSLAAAGLYLIFALVVLSWAAWFFSPQFFSGLKTIAAYFLDRSAPAGPAVGSGFAGLSLLRFVDSFWLMFGWMAFSAADVGYLIWRMAGLLSLAGILVFAARRWIMKKPAGLAAAGLGEKPWTGRLVGYSAFAVGLQLAAILAAATATRITPQGRYLFPAIFPVAFLFVLGLESLGDLFGRRAGRALVAVFLVFEVIFFVFVVWGYIAPVFHLTVRAPHPGI